MVRIMGKLKKGGFTLIELLIVVAIIGILATVGVPTFKRMVQKSKQSEAKVNLGGIYTVEAAFQSEYGAYTNNLQGAGFTMDGNTAIYAIGMLSGTCVDQIANTVANVLPSSANSIGVGINSAFPTFYTVTTGNFASFGRVGTGTCLAANVVGATGGTFTAAATGAIAPTITITSPLAVTGTPGQDAWQIDQNRTLSNLNYGIQ